LARCFTGLGERRLGALRGMLPDRNGALQPPWLIDKLRAALLAPLDLDPAATLCIVPHSLLHYVPFAALLPDRAIAYAPSATIRLRARGSADTERPQKTKTLAVAYNGARLAHAEDEARRVAAIDGGDVLTGMAATRVALLRDAPSFARLHVACHGWFNPVWPAASSLALADGAFDVSDVFRMPRLCADLISLSACESGRSRVLRGDELLGMTRAWLYAGAASVVASHWVVDDASTALLFERFYRELGRGASKARALAEAQRWLREQAQFAHPYFWAGFYVTGSP
jgi:CHAT domain-containing protein